MASQSQDLCQKQIASFSIPRYVKQPTLQNEGVKHMRGIPNLNAKR